MLGMAEKKLTVTSQCGAAQRQTMKILVVDDEPANVALLEALLAEGGYTSVKSTTESRLTVATCKEFEPDLVLLDLMMPDPDGFAVLKVLRCEVGEIFLPIIVLTADTNHESRLRALGGGATDFLLKPLDHAEVLLRIANLLETRRLQRLLENHRTMFEAAVQARTAELRAALWESQNSKSSYVVI